jgi:AcrR family transcriptional regulator
MESAELRIIEAAIAAIEEYGFENATVRRIAAKAGVNIASINYYFRTKEQLLEKVIRLTLDNAFDWSELAYAESLPPKEQLYAIMDHLSVIALNYPAMTRAHFYEAMVGGNYDSPAVREMNRFIEDTCRKIIAKGCRMSEHDLRTSVTQLFTVGVFGIGVIPNIFQPCLKEDLTNATTRRKYLKHMIDRLIDD